MRAVVDTNVIAYFLLGTEPFSTEADQFWNSLEEAVAPASWEPELASVVWMTVRKGLLPAYKSPERLDLASRLGIRQIPVRELWHGALERSLASGVSVYDTLFVELADREGIPLATFDAKVIKAFPKIAVRPGAVVSK